jgi:hypothetical protein
LRFKYDIHNEIKKCTSSFLAVCLATATVLWWVGVELADIIGDEFELFVVDVLLFVVAGGLGGLFNMPLGISLDVPLVVDVVVDVFKLLEGVDEELFVALFPILLLLLLKVDKLFFTEITGELFVLKLFAFDSILKWR